MRDRSAETWGCIVLLFLAGVAAGIGYFSHNYWFSLMVFAGMMVGMVGANAFLSAKQYAVYILVTIVGSGILGAALWMTRMAGQWLWTPLLFIIAVIHFLVAYETGDKRQRGRAAASYALSVLHLGAALALPGLLYGVMRGTAETISAQTFWTWALWVLGFTSLAISWRQGYLEDEGARYVLFAVFGILLLGGATWITGAAGGWWLLAPWLIAAGAIWHGGSDLSRFESGFKTTGFILAALCLVLAGAGPLYFFNRIPSAPAPAVETSDVDRAATQLAAAQQTATHAVLSAGEVTETMLAATKAAGIQQAEGTQAAEQTAAASIPTATLSAEDEAATQLAAAVETATAAVAPAAALPPEPVAEASRPEDRAGAGGPAAVWSFLITAVKSIWGIFHLLVLFLIGQLWLKRWGGLVTLAALFAFIGFAGGADPLVLSALEHEVASSPAGWMRDLSDLSIQAFETPGWGIVIAGAVASILIFPALRLTVIANRAMGNLPGGPGLFGSASSYQDMQKKGIDPVRTSIASIVVMVISAGLPFALWVGLRELAADSSTTAVGFLGIPDLTVPSFKPVWHAGYFLLAAVLAVVQVILTQLQKHFKLLAAGFAGCVNPVIIVLGAFGAAFFAPGGVLLFQISQSMMQSLLLPLVAVGMGPADKSRALPREKPSPKPRPIPPRRRPTPPRPKPRIPPPKPPEKKRTIKSKPPAPSATSNLNSRLVYRPSNDLIAMSAGEGEDLWTMGNSGTMTLIREGKARAFNLPLEKPGGLIYLKDEKILGISEAGEMLLLRLDEQMKLTSRINASVPFDAFAINPFRTMLAYLDCATGHVKGMFIESKKESDFARYEGLTTAIAFAHTGRELAVGAESGSVRILDIATRRQTYELLPEDGSPVMHVRADTENSWIVIYKNKRLTVWTTDGEVAQTKRLPSSATCLEISRDGRIAIGSRSGYARVYDQELKEVFKDKIHKSKIVQLLFSEDGEQLYSIGGDGSLRRTRL